MYKHKWFWTVLLLATVSQMAQAQIYRFGQDGRDGRSGEAGPDGRSGDDVSLYADGQNYNLNLNGENGQDARSRGENGQEAWSCSQPYTVDHDLRGADGGDGGRGGIGGNGGGGGDVTVYYLNEVQLKKIQIQSLGGAAGDGNRGGYGGFGCRCMQRTWQTRHCRRDSEGRTVCEYRTHYCFDGETGRHGLDGRGGLPGRRGQLYLIKSKDPLQNSIREISGQFMDLMNKNHILAENIWTTREGALTLLAPGSQLDNKYNEFVRRDAYQIQLNWAAHRDLKEFSAESARLYLAQNDAHLALPTHLWTVIEKVRNDMNFTFSISDVIKQEEVEAITFQVEGAKDATTVRIQNGASFADLITNKVEAEVSKDSTFGDKRVFNGEIPTTQLSVAGQDLLVHIGQLDIEDRKDVFKPGKKIKVKLSVTRSMGTYRTAIDSGGLKYKIPK